MSYFFLRFIPYLYYFIREQYRRDMDSTEPTKKKRYVYRTVITILILLLAMTITASVMKIRKLSEVLRTQQFTGTVIANGVGAVQNGTISRETYEKDIRELVIAKYKLEYQGRELATELKRVCSAKVSSCDEHALRTIDNYHSEFPEK